MTICQELGKQIIARFLLNQKLTEKIIFSPFESRFPINVGVTGHVATTGEVCTHRNELINCSANANDENSLVTRLLI